MPGWDEALLSDVRRRNSSTVLLENLIEEHTRLQVKASEAIQQCKRLHAENDRLVTENELLQHDVQAGKNGVKGASAPRVRSLEAQLEGQQTDMEEFRRSQQKVICRYDEDLTTAKKELERSHAKYRQLEQEKAGLVKRLELAAEELKGTQRTLEQKSEELAVSERQREELIEESKRRMAGLFHVKIKGVRKELDALKERYAEAPVVNYKQLGEDFRHVKEVVADAVESTGEDGEQEIRDALEETALAMGPLYSKWAESVRGDTELYYKVLMEKELWVEEGERTSKRVRLLCERLRSCGELLFETCLALPGEWMFVCRVVDGIVEQMACDAYSTIAPLESVLFRLNNLSLMITSYPNIMAHYKQQWEQRPAILSPPPSASGGPSQHLDIDPMIKQRLESLTSKASHLCALAANMACASNQRHLDSVYTIDMSHYKKYKHKDSYTTTHKHLRPATSDSISQYLESLDELLKPLAKGEWVHTMTWGLILKDFVSSMQKLLLQGGEKRFYYCEQAASIEEDVALAKKYFLSKKVKADVVTVSFSKLTAIVSTVMSQPTDQLISGGGVCLPFSELPEESRESVWCRSIIRQVLAHRKDKKAKQFTIKQAKKKR